MKDEVFEAALGGLFHDIGKFALRAGITASQTWDADCQRIYGHKHALLSADFALAYVPSQWQHALAGATWHHRPQGRLAQLTAIADRLSAGERDPSRDDEPQRLLSIFSRVALGERCVAESYLPLRPMTLDRSALFPRPLAELEDSIAGYGQLWGAFEARVKVLQRAGSEPDADRAAYLGNLLHLLREFTWCIPAAAYRSVPDVSLYDHSRMTAALAVCLVDRPDEELATLLPDPAQGRQTVAVLVGGDVSGVQDFLYTITARGAASALRGRSLYLQLLSDAVAGYLLRRLGLPPTNLVYSSGGRFYLLAGPGADAELAAAQRYVSRVLLHHHGGDLYLALAAEGLAASDFFGGQLAARWEGLAAALRRGKERRFAELGGDLHHLLFEPWRDEGNEERTCQVCQREHADCRQEEETRKCPACLAFEGLGDDLRRARYLSVEEVEPAFDESGAPGTVDDVLAALGARVRLLREPPAAGAPGGGRQHLLALEDRALDGVRPGPRCVVGRRYLVNVTPLGGHGQVQTSDELAQSSTGIERLGVLRMDVDNLGRVFGQGLGNTASLSRLATLSLAISLYFEGWVEELARQHNPPGSAHRAYSIYSGGDDLFFVGSWDAMATLAFEISQDFAAYTGRHPDLHLSGGLVLVGGRYPIYQAAREAGEAEEEAKAMPGKNAFCFLGQALPWPTCRRAAQQAQTLRWLVENERVSRGLLGLLTNAQAAHHEAAQRRARAGLDHTASGAPQGYYGPWIPRLEYALARLAERHPGAAQELEALRHLLREDDYRSLGWIGLAARWAELLTRADHEKRRQA